MRPWKITLVALLFGILGLCAVIKILYALSNGNISIDLGVFMIPIAFGLLKGRDSSRWWAQFWCYLYYLGCIAVAAVILFYTGPFKANWLGEEFSRDEAIWLGLPICLATFIITLAVHRVLRSRAATEFFDQVRTGSSGPGQLASSNLPKARVPFTRSGAPHR